MSTSSFVSSRRDGSTAPLPLPATTTIAPAALPSAWAWAADMVLDVFLRLGPHEVMLGAEQVCKPWRRVGLDYYDQRVGRSCYGFQKKLWRVEVDRAKGQCEAFKGYCNDRDLRRLVKRAPSLKSLSIEHYSDYYCGVDLVKALKKLTLLEDLEIDFKYIIIWEKNMLQSVCKACSRLTKLVLTYPWASEFYYNDYEYDMERIDGAIPKMPKLHTLKLHNCDLECDGLKAILDKCPRLETLLIDGYFDNKHGMDKKLKLKCARVKNLTLDTKTKPYYGGGGYYVCYSSEEYSEISSQEEDCDSQD